MPQVYASHRIKPARPVTQQSFDSPGHVLQINAAFTIKYDAFDAKGKVSFLITSKVKEADVTFLISVKFVNQVIYDHSLVRFQPVDGVDPKNFTKIYGDSFISVTETRCILENRPIALPILEYVVGMLTTLSFFQASERVVPSLPSYLSKQRTKTRNRTSKQSVYHMQSHSCL